MAPKPTDDDGWGDVAEGDGDGLESDDGWGDSGAVKKDAKAPAPGESAPVAKPASVVVEPEVAEPEVAEPEVAEPEVAEPEVAEPEVASPEVAAPKVAEPEVASPEVAESEPAVAATRVAASAPVVMPAATSGGDDDWERPLPDDPDDPDEELSSAVGVPSNKKPPKPPRTPIFTPRQRRNLILAVIGAALVGAFVISSMLNSRHLYLACGDDTVRAERGRFFPWGRTTLSGDKWKPVEIDEQCGDRELASESELEGAYLELVLSRANKNLSTVPATDVDRSSELLEQAGRLARDPERRAARDEIERLQNDVEYWRAAAEIEQAITQLEGAKKRLSEAAGRTRHTTDAGARADFLTKLVELARAGVIETSPAKTPTDAGTRPTPPPVSATPGLDAGVGVGSSETAIDAAPAPPAPLPVPSGGVLL